MPGAMVPSVPRAVCGGAEPYLPGCPETARERENGGDEGG